VSDLNCEWLIENFGNRKSVIFDIGANSLSDSVRFRRFLPDSKIYSLEPSPELQTNNVEISKNYNINYYGIAMSDKSGTAMFWPGNTEIDSLGLDTGTLMFDLAKQFNNRKSEQWLSPISVEIISFNDFCSKYNVKPDFLHIDVEGAECLILSSMLPQYHPTAVWAEISIVQETQLNLIMEEQEYYLAFKDTHDNLYVKNNIKLTDYIPFSFEIYDHNPLAITPLDRRTRIAEWLDSYKKIKDPTWPDLVSMSDFEHLPEFIKKECQEVFGFDVDKKLLEGK
jgi:FkbM family methyltransferase